MALLLSEVARASSALASGARPAETLRATMEDLCDLNFAQLERALIAEGVSAAHARGVWRALYRPGDAALPAPAARWLENQPRCPAPAVAAAAVSSDGLTHKWSLRLADGEQIETVLMAHPGRFTLCVSTQAGCAMGCVFCATGQGGLRRSLRPSEIVAQVLHAEAFLRRVGQPSVRNLVLMGMGEPLHNYDRVMTALDILTDRRGLNLAPRRVTISTVGVVPGILRMAAERRPYNLAVSLHGATDAERDALAPINRRWPLAELFAACRVFGRRVFFEWTLIDGVNDQPETAQRLAASLAGIDARVNLIPLNPTSGFAGIAAGAQAADRFRSVLRAAGIPCTIRQRRGIDVNAGCGQLSALRV